MRRTVIYALGGGLAVAAAVAAFVVAQDTEREVQEARAPRPAIDWDDPRLAVAQSEAVRSMRESVGDQDTLDRVRMPVLAPAFLGAVRPEGVGDAPADRPSDVQIVTAPTEQGGSDWYSMTLELEGATVGIDGESSAAWTTSATALDSLDTALAQTDDEQISTLDPEDEVLLEGSIVTLSFNRFGAQYTVTVECYQADDSRCADAAFARRVRDELLPIGGRP